MAKAKRESRVTALERMLQEVGYMPRRGELLALAGMATMKGAGAKAVLLTGPPGCGKTALAEAVSQVVGGEFVYSLLHAWTDSDELFTGIDVAAAVAGQAELVRQEGVLARVARMSQTATHDRPVVVCLDEIDKTPDRAEMLLLDWLQTGRVPIKPGVHIATNLAHVLVFITSNEMRPLSDALMRRLRRVRMDSLPNSVLDELVSKRANVSMEVSRSMNCAMRLAAKGEGNSHLSLQEMVKGVEEAFRVAEKGPDVMETVLGWGTRTEIGAEAGRSSTDLKAAVGVAWEMVVAYRKEVRARAKASSNEPETAEEEGDDGSE